jgi:NADH-quinone oxidoreductase subunit A
MAGAFVVIFVGISLFLGTKRPGAVKKSTYECGVPAIGDSRLRFSVRFYLVAMVFILFDVEIAFMYPWALLLKDLGTVAFWEMLVFVLILFGGLLYAWREKILEFR